MDYDYEDIASQPNIATYGYNSEGELVLISGIQFDVANSSMTDKSIVSGTWWKDTEILQLVFTNELSQDDKAILDEIVSDNT